MAELRVPPSARPVVSPPDSTEAERVAEIQARVDAATEGPWTTDGEIQSHDEFWMQYIDVQTPEKENWGFPVPARSASDAQAQADALFLAHAREDIPYLLGLLAASPPSPQLAETLRDAGLLLRADIRCNNGCGCEEYDYCAADEWDNAIVAARLASVAVGQPENTEAGT